MQDIIIDHCIICGNPNTEEKLKITDHLVTQETFSLHECNQCRFRFISNPPSPASAGKYYDTEEYVEHSDSAKGIINTLYHRARKWMLNFKYLTLKRLDRPKKILDFGTGTGYFLNFMKSKGFEVAGIEINTKARQFGKNNFDLKIYDPEAIYLPGMEGDFGYITFWHVLEHVYNPEKVLIRVRELLSDQGCLVVALPNYNCLEEKIYGNYWNGYDVPRHLWHFNYDNFVQMAEKTGYILRKTKVLPLDPFYNCLISESYRKKKWAHILIPFIGCASLIIGLLNHKKASSVIYFLEKE